MTDIWEDDGGHTHLNADGKPCRCTFYKPAPRLSSDESAWEPYEEEESPEMPKHPR